MPKLNHILVCVDGREAGFHALKEAIHLAQWIKGSVTVMTVTLLFEGDLSLVGVKNIGKVITGPAETVLTEAKHIAAAHHVPIRILCAEGHPGDQILICAELCAADLIVIGAERFMPSWPSFIISSTLMYLVNNCKRDLFIVPHKTRFTGDDFLVVCRRESFLPGLLSRSTEFLSFFGGENMMVCKYDDPRKKDPIVFSSQVKTDAILYFRNERELLRHAENKHASLMMLEKEPRYSKWRFLKGLKIEKLIRSSPCPVMIPSMA